ncbi:MAG: PilZ domain-containing protein [Acetobacteraceae bacterium]|nr:PilZ domain-containing protein [Acetobacteraceae bacterium]
MVALDVQELYRLHLRAGSGARVEVSCRGATWEGRWLASGEDFQVSLPAEPGGISEGGNRPDLLRADLRVHLGTGIHSFPARLRRVKGMVWAVSVAGPVKVLQRRRAVRLPVDLGVLCRSVRGEQRLRAKDVSPGGVLLRGSGERRVGEELELEFAEKPWSELGLVKGEVMWTHCADDGGGACGVAFRGLSRQQERLLVHLVARGLARQAAREA